MLIVAEGATSRQLNRNRIQASSELSNLAKSAQQAGTILGATDVELLDLPDNRLDSLDRLDLIKTIEERLNAYWPQVVYLHHAGDVNVDHRRLHEAVVTACRPTPGQSVLRLLSFEVVSSTEWQTPDLRRHLGRTGLSTSRSICNENAKLFLAYSSETRPWPHSRSIEAIEHLSHWRGAQVGVDAAEAFCLLRQIQ